MKNHFKKSSQLPQGIPCSRPSDLAALYQDYSHLVLGICMKYLRDRETARDTAVEIILQVNEKMQQHEVKNFNSWIYSISKNYCLSQMRKKKITAVEINPRMEDRLAESVSEPEFSDDSFSRLHESMAHLKEGQKTCIELFFFRKMSYQAIANSTGMTLKEIKSHIQNGKVMLKKLLTQKGFQFIAA